ncbi:costars family protein [Blyttiomyces helicus]|uniref:Costars family protein n=1 Tax=Blyttiomyces helicus TaxID=388810 RepID=A0A4P9W3K6_9FUNG|nr:costars family protein [Blyttiomyces helicus]|eukprot:RKO85368.1 costars family protein [Blyttiomyces helicus]
MQPVIEEIKKLITEMHRLGKPDDQGRLTVKFGVLVRDDKIANILEGLVGTLKAAKKRKIIDFQGEILLQGAHDNVDVILLQETVSE